MEFNVPVGFQLEVNIATNNFEETEKVIQKAISLLDKYEEEHMCSRALLVVKYTCC